LDASLAVIIANLPGLDCFYIVLVTV